MNRLSSDDDSEVSKVSSCNKSRVGIWCGFEMIALCVWESASLYGTI